MLNERNKILYVDDEQENLDVFQICFDMHYEVFVAQSKHEVLEIMEQNEIKVFLTDQRMPEISGIELISIVNEKYPEIPCLIVSAYADKDLLFKAVNEADIFRVIEKPWSENEVLHSIEKAIEYYDTVHERNKIYDELESALKNVNESDRLKSEFLSNISHEIRTPLNGIVGFVNLLDKFANDNEEFLKYMEIIKRSASNLTTIIEDIIIASRIKCENLQPVKYDFYLNDLLDELFEEFNSEAERKGIVFTIKKRVGKKKIPITTDKEKLHTIYTNLLKNAFKFTKEGEIEFGLYDEENSILFVKDTGIGISEDENKSVFEYFRQAKQDRLSRNYEGNGLGLSIVKDLVEIMDGDIWFESKEGEGTTFYFKLPLNIVV